MSAISGFIVVGENIHCTRVHKVGGAFVKTPAGGAPGIVYREHGRQGFLPIPRPFLESADWSSGKVKHAAAAIWQGLHGDPRGQEAGTAYIEHLARSQQDHGASFLDLNVDEFSTDLEERIRAVRWAAAVIQRAAALPLSIDSSHLEILKAGLEVCDPSRGKPMINSVSLERSKAVDLAREMGAVVIAGATGETSMPHTVEDRVANLDALMNRLRVAGFQSPDIYLDPLVVPASVDPNNGAIVPKAIRALRENYGPEIHFAPGLSNVSYGMPDRKLINLVFTRLCIQEGLDGGIVDPLQINRETLASLDTGSDAFRLARAFLTGEDPFGMEFITAVREDRV